MKITSFRNLFEFWTKKLLVFSIADANHDMVTWYCCMAFVPFEFHMNLNYIRPANLNIGRRTKLLNWHRRLHLKSMLLPVLIFRVWWCWICLMIARVFMFRLSTVQFEITSAITLLCSNFWVCRTISIKSYLLPISFTFFCPFCFFDFLLPS